MLTLPRVHQRIPHKGVPLSLFAPAAAGASPSTPPHSSAPIECFIARKQIKIEANKANPFRIRTCKKGWGGGGKRLTGTRPDSTRRLPRRLVRRRALLRCASHHTLGVVPPSKRVAIARDGSNRLCARGIAIWFVGKHGSGRCRKGGLEAGTVCDRTL